MHARPTRPSRILDSATAVGLIGAVLFFVVAATWSFSSPLMSAPDEPAQTVKAVSVAEGNLRGVDIQTTPAASPWIYSVQSTFTVPAAYADLGRLNACYVIQPLVPATCAPDPQDDVRVGDGHQLRRHVPTHATTPSSAGPSRFFDPAVGLWLMRLSSAAVSALLVGLALAGARRTDGGGVVVAGLLVAITPMAVYVSSVINPSGMEIMAALRVMGCVLAAGPARRPDHQGRRDPGRGRPERPGRRRGPSPRCSPSASWPACVVMAARRDDLHRIRRSPWFVPAAAVVGRGHRGGGGLPRLVEGLRIGGGCAREGHPRGGAPGIALEADVACPPDGRLLRLPGGPAAEDAARHLGRCSVAACSPPALVAGTWRRRFVLIALVARHRRVHRGARGVQRPAGGLRLAGPLLPAGRRRHPDPGGVDARPGDVVALPLRHPGGRRRSPCCGSLGQVLGQAATLRRFVTGTTGGLFDFLGRDGWKPPLPPVVLVGVMVIGGALFAGWAAMTAVRSERLLVPTGSTTTAISRRRRRPPARRAWPRTPRARSPRHGPGPRAASVSRLAGSAISVPGRGHQAVDVGEEQAVDAVAHDLGLTTCGDDHRDRTGRHGLDRGDAEVLGPHRIGVEVLVEAGGVPVDRGGAVEPVELGTGGVDVHDDRQALRRRPHLGEVGQVLGAAATDEVELPALGDPRPGAGTPRPSPAASWHGPDRERRSDPPTGSAGPSPPARAGPPAARGRRSPAPTTARRSAG